ncbi:hypothetical protein [Aequorivita antarctica]|uniref:Uncharacterized protein n=1 Tax=Aequorivita antarctica TaxID=153266 RepID=A0A5C6YUY2_9FLAO|nr:hypothetical protein [Aequorivita antarctica]TXD71358.1 hypothetical protein ESU54_17080 [Aequorivita antarctica]
MKKSIKTILIIVISFGFYFFLDELYFIAIRKWLFDLTNQSGLIHIITYTISGIPLFFGTLLITTKLQNMFFKAFIKDHFLRKTYIIPFYLFAISISNSLDCFFNFE